MGFNPESVSVGLVQERFLCRNGIWIHCKSLMERILTNFRQGNTGRDTLRHANLVFG